MFKQLWNCKRISTTIHIEDQIIENQMTEDQDIDDKYFWCKDKIMIGIGIFVFACIIVIIVILTIYFLSIHSNTVTYIHTYYNDTLINNTNISGVYGINNTTLSGVYGINNSVIYFYSNGNIKFKLNTRANVLIVGGGGGASYGGGWISGGSGTGGGGGGCVGEGILTFTANTVYDIIVGNGGRLGHNKR